MDHNKKKGNNIDEAKKSDDIDENTDIDIQNEQINQSKSKRSEPSFNDYLAGAMLANGIIWIWLQLIQIFGSQMSEYTFFTDLSFIVFIFAGYIAAFQVGKRVDTEHLTVGLKTAGYSLIMSLIIMYTSWPAASNRLALTLMLCLVFGGVIGGYMNIRRRIEIRRKKMKDAST